MASCCFASSIRRCRSSSAASLTLLTRPLLSISWAASDIAFLWLDSTIRRCCSSAARADASLMLALRAMTSVKEVKASESKIGAGLPSASCRWASIIRLACSSFAASLTLRTRPRLSISSAAAAMASCCFASSIRRCRSSSAASLTLLTRPLLSISWAASDIAFLWLDSTIRRCCSSAARADASLMLALRAITSVKVLNCSGSKIGAGLPSTSLRCCSS